MRAAAIGFLGDALDRLSDNGADEALSNGYPRSSSGSLAARRPTIVRRRGVEAVGSLSQTTNDDREIIQDAYEHGDQAMEAAALVCDGTIAR